MQTTTPEIIEGVWRVVAVADLPAAAAERGSPNRRRAVVRILFWNVVGLAAVVALPILF